EDPAWQERLCESSEEDLHPRLHEHALRPLAHAVQFDEPVEIGLERFGVRHADRVRARLGLEPPGLPSDLVTELGRKPGKVLLVRSRKWQEWRDTVLIVDDLRLEALSPHSVLD